MTTVTYNNLCTASRSNVVSLITANVDDPITTSSEYRKWIYSRRPDVKSNDFNGYPIIIIHPARVIPENKGTIGGKRRFVDMEIGIEIISSDRGYGDKDGQGLTHMDSVSDSILQVLLNKTNRDSLRSDLMSFSTPVVSDVITETIQNELVYRRVITASFRSLISISA